MSVYRQVLAAVDFQEGAETVARRAGDLARNFGAKLALLHVVEPIPVDAASETLLTPSVSIETELYDNARERLHGLCERLALTDVQQHVTVGYTKREIMYLAEQLQTDLIVVGSHGRHGLALLLGSTANAVLHGAPCDVLAVRI